ncbi:MAG TPA: hypothetical protein VIT67_11140, partial [Povalibacter sp.]
MRATAPLSSFVAATLLLCAGAPFALAQETAETPATEQPAAPTRVDPVTPEMPVTPPQETAPEKVESVETTVSEMGAMDVCSQMEGDQAQNALERVRRGISITACASSAWLDGMFGDQLRYEEYRETYGTVSTGALWSEYDGFDP